MTATQETYNDLSGKLRINLRNLDNECAEQANNYGTAAREYADAMSEMRRAKLKRDRERAALELKVRANPDTYGIGKVTDSAVQACVAGDANVRQLEDAALDAENLATRWEGLLNAWEQRRSMLNNEVRLYSGEYYGDPDAGGGERERRREALERRRTADAAGQ